MSNLPNTEECRTFASTLELTEKTDTVANIVPQLLSFVARLRRARGPAPDTAVFLMKTGRVRHSKGEKGNDRKGDDWKGNDWKSQVICHGSGVKGYIKAKCRSKYQWASYETSESNANLALTASTSTAEFQSESFLFSVIHSDLLPDSTPYSVITGNLAAAIQSADYWILGTGVTNHVTGNHHLSETSHPMAIGEDQVKTANNSLFDAKGSGTSSFYVDRPNANPANIVLQDILYVPACGTNNLVSIIQSLRKEVNFLFKLNGAAVSLGSVLIYEAPLINSVFVLKASVASVSKAAVAVDDPPSTTPSFAPGSVPKISEVYSIIRHDMDIIVWLARLSHLSSPAIIRLPNTV